MRSNVARSKKWYSRPFFSLARGARVVWETLKRSSGKLARSFLVSVVFPAPLGDDKMRRTKPESCAITWGKARTLLDVLHLLAHALDLGFHLDHGVGERGIGALGADRVCFAHHLLKQEIEAT